MMKKRNINLILFSIFLAFLISLPILCVDRYLSHPDIPWQLAPFNADSLSHIYKEKYTQLGSDALILSIQDSSRPVVMVLVDGWGVPYDESLLDDDFAKFNKDKIVFSLHKRLLQRTTYAENVEYKQGFINGILLETGDSTTCAEKDREQGSHFKQTLCCINCDDIQALATLDSLTKDGSWKRIAWTTRETREGDRGKLHTMLQELSKMATKHPNIQFVIQGAHRPILGAPDTRRKYLAPWVPAVFVNCSLKEFDATRN